MDALPSDNRNKKEVRASLVRVALQKYQKEKGLNTQELLDEINSVSKHKIKYISFLRFIGGKDKRSENKSYTIPRPQTLEAILYFLEREDFVIKAHENDDIISSYGAPERLLDYLDIVPGEERNIPTSRIRGTYFTYIVDGDENLIKEITLSKPNDDGVIQIKEEQHFYEVFCNGTPYLDQASNYEYFKKLTPISKHFLSGWAIITPEDNFLFFLKNEASGHNRYYFSYLYEETLWPNVYLEKLVLVQLDYPDFIDELDKRKLNHLGCARKTIPSKVVVFYNKRHMNKIRRI